MARPIDPSFAYALDAVKSLLKPVEAGAAVSIFLFGLSTMQVYLYFSRFPKDRWMIKLLVTTIYLLQLGQVLAIVHYIYTVSIDWYGRPEKYMVKASPGLYIEVLLGGTISTIVQFFLALRAGRFSDSHIITGTLWILAVASYAFIIAIVVVLYMFSLKEFLNDWNWLVAAGKTISTVLDVAVAVLLCYFLFRERKLALKRTTKMVDRLIVMTLQTGLLTSLLSLGVMIAFTVGALYIWVGMFMCLGGLHSNSLLVSLNARTELRRLDRTSVFTMNGSTSHRSRFTASLAFARPSNMTTTQTPVEVSVHSQRSTPHGVSSNKDCAV